MTDETTTDETARDGQRRQDETSTEPTATETERPTSPDGGTSTTEEAVGSDTGESTEPSQSAGHADDSVLGGRFRRWVNYLVLAALAILALVAGIRFYAAIGTIIDRFVVREFRPVFHATFNLALLLLAGAGVTVQLRRMR
jgi:hypothetical protein